MLKIQWSYLACTKLRMRYSPFMNWEWGYMSVILAFKTLKTADDKFRVILNLHTEFEASCGYMRPCLKNKHYCLIWPSVLQLMMTIFVHCEHIVHCPDCLPSIVTMSYAFLYVVLPLVSHKVLLPLGITFVFCFFPVRKTVTFLTVSRNRLLLVSLVGF